ncbi:MULTISPECIES: hypothetical protein [Chromobacterium]|uniref:hypothetical protein n=1 Tax=Chromobacterium TaxID=535 RepID=UPI0018871657|nr:MULTISPECIES: hypothetical protein [Chromobacterium]QOZ84497.1 hypothetical protein DXT74_16260 [Chromobacterium sp. Rain0013]WON84677.1 hypothetical protein OK026_03955 [Chromobacterium haemolyticum]
MNHLSHIIMPVLRDLPASHLKRELLEAFERHGRHFEAIEAGFARLTAQRQSPETLRRFFQSWSQTNNSAMTVAGISNRMTLLIHTGRPVADREALLAAMVCLNRIVDEDLAVTHKILHAQMYYNMATGIVGDDQWLSHAYLHPSAKAFKSWKDHQSLREPDLAIALLTTLTHEIYTHGEVEFILPLFRRWLTQTLGFAERDATRTLGWISVHCGPTEKNHFFHAMNAIRHYARAMALDLERYSLDGIVGAYLEQKAAVLETVALDVAVEAL